MIVNVLTQQRNFGVGIIFLITLTFTYTSDSFIYGNKNSKDVFKAFKQKYNKIYENESQEKTGYENFVKNLNELTRLNGGTKDKTKFFILNQYADLDAQNIEEHYAFRIVPYDTISNNTEANIVGRMKRDNIDFSKMYDLYKADEMYKEYMRKHNRNVSKEYDRIVHYYRFIKTLIEINRSTFEGNDDERKELGDNADIVNEPNEYFY